MEAVVRLVASQDADVHRQGRVQFLADPVRSILAVQTDIGHLTQGMHARIRTAGARQLKLVGLIWLWILCYRCAPPVSRLRRAVFRTVKLPQSFLDAAMARSFVRDLKYDISFLHFSSPERFFGRSIFPTFLSSKLNAHAIGMANANTTSVNNVTFSI